MKYKKEGSDIHKYLLESFNQYCRKYGIKPITRICPFLNDDVPKFLKKLDVYMKKSRKEMDEKAKRGELETYACLA